MQMYGIRHLSVKHRPESENSDELRPKNVKYQLKIGGDNVLIFSLKLILMEVFALSAKVQ